MFHQMSYILQSHAFALCCTRAKNANFPKDYYLIPGCLVAEQIAAGFIAQKCVFNEIPLVVNGCIEKTALQL